MFLWNTSTIMVQHMSRHPVFFSTLKLIRDNGYNYLISMTDQVKQECSNELLHS